MRGVDRDKFQVTCYSFTYGMWNLPFPLIEERVDTDIFVEQFGSA